MGRASRSVSNGRTALHKTVGGRCGQTLAPRPLLHLPGEQGATSSRPASRCSGSGSEKSEEGLNKGGRIPPNGEVTGQA